MMQTAVLLAGIRRLMLTRQSYDRGNYDVLPGGRNRDDCRSSE